MLVFLDIFLLSVCYECYVTARHKIYSLHTQRWEVCWVGNKIQIAPSLIFTAGAGVFLTRWSSSPSTQWVQPRPSISPFCTHTSLSPSQVIVVCMCQGEKREHTFNDVGEILFLYCTFRWWEWGSGSTTLYQLLRNNAQRNARKFTPRGDFLSSIISMRRNRGF